MPRRLQDMVPNQISDENVFKCYGNWADPMGYIYLPGLNGTMPVDLVVAFDKKKSHMSTRIVMFLNCQVQILPEAQFQAIAARMLSPECRLHYSPEAIALLEDVVSGREIDTHPERWGAVSKRMAIFWGVMLALAIAMHVLYALYELTPPAAGDQPKENERGGPC